MVIDKFNKAFNGYNIEEVNAFIDEMAMNYENLLNKLEEKEREISSLKEKLNNNESFDNNLFSFNKSENLKIIDEAKKNASRIVNDALIEAERLENRKEKLRQELITLKRKARANLEVTLQSIDDLDDIL